LKKGRKKKDRPQKIKLGYFFYNFTSPLHPISVHSMKKTKEKLIKVLLLEQVYVTTKIDSFLRCFDFDFWLAKEDFHLI
jgi:hypothetical protein